MEISDCPLDDSTTRFSGSAPIRFNSTSFYREDSRGVNVNIALACVRIPPQTQPIYVRWPTALIDQWVTNAEPARNIRLLPSQTTQFPSCAFVTRRLDTFVVPIIGSSIENDRARPTVDSGCPPRSANLGIDFRGMPNDIRDVIRNVTLRFPSNPDEPAATMFVFSGMISAEQRIARLGDLLTLSYLFRTEGSAASLDSVRLFSVRISEPEIRDVFSLSVNAESNASQSPTASLGQTSEVRLSSEGSVTIRMREGNNIANLPNFVNRYAHIPLQVLIRGEIPAATIYIPLYLSPFAIRRSG